jgi:hypothetical protein
MLTIRGAGAALGLRLDLSSDIKNSKIKDQTNSGPEFPDGWARFERAVDAAVKSGPKHRASRKKMIVFGIVNEGGKWRPFEPYCLLPDGRIESTNLASSG